jgi:glycosyltransferase involved in cell wall biosynthesis
VLPTNHSTRQPGEWPAASTTCKVLLISEGEFSGVRPALMAALERSGCEVIYRRQSLRELGLLRYWYGLWMVANAFIVYRGDALRFIERTSIAYRARSRVSRTLISRYPGIDLVLQIAANSVARQDTRPPRTKFAVYTDYMNLLSKALPDYGFALEERSVHAMWNVLERQTLLAQDHVFVMGSHVKPAIEAAYELAPERITVVGAGPGLDLDIERDGRTKDFANRSILFVGKQPEKKGLRVLLKAFAQVRERFPDAVLHVVTGKRVSAPGVVFHGRVTESQLRDLFYASSIFTLPAFKEPLGLVYLEAMWSKTACVGTNTGSMPELIQDGESGYLVEPGDHAALAQRLIALLENPDRTKQMAENGYAAARRYWHWDLVVQRMLNGLGFTTESPITSNHTLAEIRSRQI